MSSFTLLNEMAMARSIEELWPAYCEEMAGFGFDRLIYGFTLFRTETSLGDPEDFVILSNHDPRYLDWFMGDNAYQNAPMVRWALENDGAVSWRVLLDKFESGALPRADAEIVERNRAFGVCAGYTVSFNSVTPRAKAAIAITACEGMSQPEVDEIWEAHADTLMALSNVLHLKVLSLPRYVPGRPLTRRQIEALHWIGHGKTTADAAKIMNLAPATVEKHLRLARDVLAVETTAQAVLKASLHNQIFVLDR
ncbi:LuxR family transcriptional regulator [Rhodobacteraceae bacterium 63075]|nr:LuxR family transcriptional regulator [Rhodobacteraceae bacterium 63075]